MKKMIAFFIATIFALAMKHFVQDDFSSLLDFDKMIVVSSEQLSEEYILSGQDYYNIFTQEEGVSLMDTWEEVDEKGVNLYFSADKTLSYFEQRVENLTQTSNVENYSCWQGYYFGYKDFRWINKKKINFQLVKTDEGWIMGFPQILTGF